MANTDPQDFVEQELAGTPPPKSRSTMVNNPDLVAAMIHFLDLKAAGDERAHVTLRWFYVNKLQPRFGGPCYDTARRYITGTMRRDAVTGEKLQ